MFEPPPYLTGGPKTKTKKLFKINKKIKSSFFDKRLKARE
jgi:hypothetical protein